MSLEFPNPLRSMLPHEIKIVSPPLTLTSNDEPAISRIRGSLVGLAVSDAIGVSAYSRSHEDLCAQPITCMMGGGKWDLTAGKWSNVTSMALCLASSLIIQKGFNPYDQLVRYGWFSRFGYLSSTRKGFGNGNITGNALSEFSRRQVELMKKVGTRNEGYIEQLSLNDIKKYNFDVNCGRSSSTSNGALMRLAPIPLFFYHEPSLAVKYSDESAPLTHGGDLAADACRYYGALIVAAVQGESKENILSADFYKNHQEWFDSKRLHPQIEHILEGSFKKPGGYEEGIPENPNISLVIEAALWAFWSSETFKEGVFKTANLGIVKDTTIIFGRQFDDADTTTALYGQLAGAYYGYENIPSEWREQLYANEFITCVSDWIYHLGHRNELDASKGEA